MAPSKSTKSNSLAGCVIAFVGSHTVCPDLKDNSLGDLKTSILNQGGAFASKVTDECTHLVADQKQYEKNGVKVKQATQLGTIKVVQYAWLVKSLSSTKKVDESSYLLNHAKTSNSNDTEAKSSTPPQTNKRKREVILDSEDGNVVDAPSKSKKQTPQDASGAKRPPVRIPVDENCRLRDTHQVYRDDNGVAYDATLNQTDSHHNSNKFYRIQLLMDPRGRDHRSWARWGRVGETGQSTFIGSGSLDVARNQFHKRFREKTGHKWENRHDPAKKGKYTYVERQYEESGDEEEEEDMAAAKRRGSPNQAIESNDTSEVESVLHQAVQDLIKLIFNTDLFNQTMASMDYDAHKMPLGKLSKATLTRGYQVLKDIAAVLNDHSLAQSEYGQSLGQAVESLSNSYFSLIPHSFGRNRPPVIQDDRLMKKEIELIESLTDMRIANEIMRTAKGDSKEQSVNIIDRQYNGLGMQEMTPLDKTGPEFQHIQEYLVKSVGKTHRLQYKVQDVFRIERQGEKDRFLESSFADMPNSDRRLLWHGSRASNFGGILSQGLRVAPTTAVSTGSMFSQGIYTADMSSKAAGYTHSYASSGTGLLLLCEVELGDPPLKLTRADPQAAIHAKQQGCISTWGVGMTAPKAWKDAGCIHGQLQGIKMPDVSVEPGQSDEPQTGLRYNEYIVYDVTQVRLRYLVRAQM